MEGYAFMDLISCQWHVTRNISHSRNSKFIFRLLHDAVLVGGGTA